jgi:hypothetical protein
MAASDHLQQRQFFHGSPQHFEPGEVIKPGHAPTRGDTEAGKVYVTPHQFVAAQYTWAFDHQGKLAPGQDERQGGTGPAGHIYEVEPVGRLLKDKNAPRHMSGLAYTAREAKVIRKVPRQEWYGNG